MIGAAGSQPETRLTAVQLDAFDTPPKAGPAAHPAGVKYDVIASDTLASLSSTRSRFSPNRARAVGLQRLTLIPTTN